MPRTTQPRPQPKLLGLRQEQARAIITLSYVAYFATSALSIALFVFEMPVLLRAVTVIIPSLHIFFILLGMLLKNCMEFFTFYEPYPTNTRVPISVLYVGDWLIASALGMATATLVSSQTVFIVAAVFIMVGQVICLIKSLSASY